MYRVIASIIGSVTSIRNLTDSWILMGVIADMTVCGNRLGWGEKSPRNITYRIPTCPQAKPAYYTSVLNTNGYKAMRTDLLQIPPSPPFFCIPLVFPINKGFIGKFKQNRTPDFPVIAPIIPTYFTFFSPSRRKWTTQPLGNALVSGRTGKAGRFH
jgi:hypothetical protein